MTETGDDLKLLIIGAGGHAKVVIDAARAAGWHPAACLAPAGATQCLGVPVIGDDDRAASLFSDGWRHAVVAIGANGVREKIGSHLSDIGFQLPAIIHPSAVISATARIGQGVVIMPNATVNAEACIEFAAIINTGAIVEHDCYVGAGSHVAPRSVLAGHVRIGARVLFGVGSVARPGVSVADDMIVGAGSVVVADVPPGSGIVLGVPARPLGRNDS